MDDKFVFYFDSTSDPIPKLINGFATNVVFQGQHMNPKIDLAFHQNNKIEHQMKNTECGMFSMYFMIQFLKQIPFKTIINSKINDEDAFQLRDDYYLDKHRLV